MQCVKEKNIQCKKDFCVIDKIINFVNNNRKLFPKEETKELFDTKKDVTRCLNNENIRTNL